MKIAVIGAGNVGGTLGKAFGAKGHAVCYGLREPKDAKTAALVAATGSSAKAAPVKEAAASAEVVVLCVPWEAAQAALADASDALNGKVLIDAIEPVSMGPQLLEKGLLIGHDTSAGEEVARWAPRARVVKAFNTTGWPNMAKPQYGPHKASMPYCGDDPAAKATAAKLIEDVGFEPIDAGPLRNARLLEPMGMLWIYLAFTGMGTDFAFKLLRR
jgi:predicted dinucleotide-binding enzyme